MLWVLVVGLAFVVLLGDLLIFLLKSPAFKRELRYINMEIARSDADEGAYWKKCKRRLILSAFLFSTYD